MNSKILIGIFFMILLSSFVFAQPLTRNMTAEQMRVMIQEREEFRESYAVGLERASIVVDNEVAAQKIDEIMNRIQERNRLMLQNMEEIKLSEIEDEEKVIVQAKTEAKFLGFINTNREVIFIVDEEGNFERKSRPFDIFFRYNENIRNAEGWD